VVRCDGALGRRRPVRGPLLIVAANYFFRGTVAKANEIVEEYGLIIEDSEPRGAVEAPLIEADILTTGLTSFTFNRPSPVRVTDAKRAKIIVGSPVDRDMGFVAISRDKGEVVVLTQSLWWLWAGRDSKDTDNGHLLVNLLTGARRQATPQLRQSN
jgi:hypothetical protein